MTTLSAWLLIAMLSWTGFPACPSAKTPDPCAAFEKLHREPAASFHERLEDVAAALEEVAGSFASNAVANSALDLAALAFEESGFRRWVDDGSCNTFTGLLPRGEWDCDNRRAYTVWQIRPDLQYVPAGATPVTGAMLLADRVVAANMAWKIYLASPSQWATWPRAHALAVRWREAHPFR